MQDLQRGLEALLGQLALLRNQRLHSAAFQPARGHLGQQRRHHPAIGAHAGGKFTQPLGRSLDIAHAQTGRQHFGKTAEQKRLLRQPSGQSRQGRGLHRSVHTVFDDVEPMRAHHGGNRFAPLHAHGGAGGVVQGRRAVQKLGIKGLGCTLQRLGRDALVVGLDADKLQAHRPR